MNSRYSKTFMQGRKNEWELSIAPLEVDYQRNGVSGEGFHVVKARVSTRYGDNHPSTEVLIIIQQMHHEDHGWRSHTSVVNPLDLSSHYRGDNFAELTHQVITDWKAER